MQRLVRDEVPAIQALFDHLHNHAEISWQEHETTAYLADFLSRNGCQVKTFDNCTGVIGDWGNEPPTVAVRGDLDALWQRVNGEERANHSCGHDAHMAAVSGVLLALNRMEPKPSGGVRFLFQPAEETALGALKMVEKGAVDNLDYLFGLHLRPIEEMPHGQAAAAIRHGAGCFFDGRIEGESAHGARPHLGTNAIEVGAVLVQAVRSIHVNPMTPHSIKVTRFAAGGNNLNIIPGHGIFGIDVRAQTNQAMDTLVASLKHVVASVARQFDVHIDLKMRSRTAAAEVHPAAQTIMKTAISESLGANNAHDEVITAGGDDFHFYTLERPNLKATMLGLGCDLKPGLHHPDMTFNRDALAVGTEILLRAVCHALAKRPTTP